MREFLELRLSAEEAALYVPGYATQSLDPLDTVRLHLDVREPLVEKLRTVKADYQEQGTTLFTMCELTVHYTAKELQAAEWIKVEFWPFFMPSGEECGTRYDEARACLLCGAGAPQLGELRLNVAASPRAGTWLSPLVLSSSSPRAWSRPCGPAASPASNCARCSVRAADPRMPGISSSSPRPRCKPPPPTHFGRTYAVGKPKCSRIARPPRASFTYAKTRRLPPHLTQANTSKPNVLLSISAQSTRGVLCFTRSFLTAASLPALDSAVHA